VSYAAVFPLVRTRAFAGAFDYSVPPELAGKLGPGALVAVPLGSGATVEGQVTGEETHGGVQLRAVGLTEQALAAWHAAQQVSPVCCEAALGESPAAAGSAC